jgi:hypothetical protein
MYNVFYTQKYVKIQTTATYQFSLGVALGIVAELKDGNNNCYSQTTEKYNKYSTNVVYSQGVCFALLAFFVACTSVARIFPPFVI